LCCVGPTVLALHGVVSTGTALVWATDLYGGCPWWFRAGWLLLLALVRPAHFVRACGSKSITHTGRALRFLVIAGSW